MAIFKNFSLKLFAVIALLALISIGVAAVLSQQLGARVIHEFSAQHRQDMQESLLTEWRRWARSIVLVIAHRSIQPISELDFFALKTTANDFVDEGDVTYVYILDSEGRILAEGGALSEEKGVGRTLFAPPLTDDVLAADEMTLLPRDDALIIVQPVMLGNARQGSIVVGFSKERVLSNIRHHHDRIDAIILKATSSAEVRYIAITSASLLVMLIAIYFLSRRIALPIVELTRVAQKIGAGDFSQRIDVQGEDEIGRLSITFNRMVENLQNTMVSRDYVDSILKSMTEALLVISPDGTICRVNRGALNMLGYSEEELLGQPARNVITDMRENDASALLEFSDEKTSNEVGVSSVERFLVRRDGSRVPVLFSSSTLRDMNGAPNGYVCVARDITLLRQAERELRESEGQLKDAQRIAHMGSWTLDSTTDELHWSDEVYRIFEIDPDDFAPSYERLLDAIHPEDREYVDWAFRDSLENRTPYNIEHRLLMSDGRVKWVNERCQSYYDGAGKAIRSVGTVQDITDHKELEKRLVRAQRLEALGNLAGGASHELNNMLFPMMALTDMVLKTLPEDSPERRKLLKVVEAGEKAKSIVSRLLSFSRMERTERKHINIRECVRNSIDIVRHTIPSSVKLTEHLDEDVGEVFADPKQVETIVIDLASNSADAMAGKTGNLEVSLSRVDVDSKTVKLFPELDVGAYAKLMVADTGCGMDDEVLDRIFNPFYTTKDVGEGSGMGLPVVHGIVEQYSGAIRVQSEVGKGTIVEVYLPLTDKDQDNGENIGH